MNTYLTGRILLGRLPKGGDLLKEITRVVTENGIETGTLMVIGAVSRARFGFYDQEGREYHFKEVDRHLEIVSCSGNISLLDNQPMVHAHIVLADEDGNTVGGHLAEGTVIFAGEAYIRELKGEKLVRSYDKPTGLSLW